MAIDGDGGPFAFVAHVNEGFKADTPSSGGGTAQSVANQQTDVMERNSSPGQASHPTTLEFPSGAAATAAGNRCHSHLAAIQRASASATAALLPNTEQLFDMQFGDLSDMADLIPSRTSFEQGGPCLQPPGGGAGSMWIPAVGDTSMVDLAPGEDGPHSHHLETLLEEFCMGSSPPSDVQRQEQQQVADAGLFILGSCEDGGHAGGGSQQRQLYNSLASIGGSSHHSPQGSVHRGGGGLAASLPASAAQRWEHSAQGGMLGAGNHHLGALSGNSFFQGAQQQQHHQQRGLLSVALAGGHRGSSGGEIDHQVKNEGAFQQQQQPCSFHPTSAQGINPRVMASAPTSRFQDSLAASYNDIDSSSSGAQPLEPYGSRIPVACGAAPVSPFDDPTGRGNMMLALPAGITFSAPPEPNLLSAACASPSDSLRGGGALANEANGLNCNGMSLLWTNRPNASASVHGGEGRGRFGAGLVGASLSPQQLGGGDAYGITGSSSGDLYQKLHQFRQQPLPRQDSDSLSIAQQQQLLQQSANLALQQQQLLQQQQQQLLHQQQQQQLLHQQQQQQQLLQQQEQAINLKPSLMSRRGSQHHLQMMLQNQPSEGNAKLSPATQYNPMLDGSMRGANLFAASMQQQQQQPPAGAKRGLDLSASVPPPVKGSRGIVLDLGGPGPQASSQPPPSATLKQNQNLGPGKAPPALLRLSSSSLMPRVSPNGMFDPSLSSPSGTAVALGGQSGGSVHGGSLSSQSLLTNTGGAPGTDAAAAAAAMETGGGSGAGSRMSPSGPLAASLDCPVMTRIQRPDGTYRELEPERVVQLHRYRCEDHEGNRGVILSTDREVKLIILLT